MKILITILLALFISSNAFALSKKLNENIIVKGKVVSTASSADGGMRLIIIYTGTAYGCYMPSNKNRFGCDELSYDY